MASVCSRCGTSLQTEDSFCPRCGQPSAAAPTAANPTALGASALRLTVPQWLLVGASVLLLIALLLPWWSVTAIFLGTFSLDGFHSWGWLSFISWLVVVLLTAGLVARQRVTGTSLATMIDNRRTLWLVVGAGAAEILGDLLFIAVAPSGSGNGYSAGIGAGVVIAIICGLLIMYAGLLMIDPPWLPKPKMLR